MNCYTWWKVTNRECIRLFELIFDEKRVGSDRIRKKEETGMDLTTQRVSSTKKK